MRQVLLAISIFVIQGQTFCQTSFDLKGKWVVFEMISDRLYINFENDSLHFFDKEDRLKSESKEVKTNIRNGLDVFRQVSMNFDSNKTFSFDFMGNLEIGTYHIIPNRSYLILTNKDIPKSDTLKLKPKGVIEYDLSDEYEKRIFTFKRKSS